LQHTEGGKPKDFLTTLFFSLSQPATEKVLEDLPRPFDVFLGDYVVGIVMQKMIDIFWQG
jgi:hypothetical protein